MKPTVCDVQITLGDLEKLVGLADDASLKFLLQKGAGVVIASESRILSTAFDSGCSIGSLRFLEQCGASTFGDEDLERALKQKDLAVFEIAQHSKRIKTKQGW